MKIKHKGIAVGAFGAIFWLGTLIVLASRPDFNPFYVYRIFSNLRVITDLRSLDAQVKSFFSERSRYPADREELLKYVHSADPGFQLEKIPFDYRAEKTGYTICWSRQHSEIGRDSVIIHNGRVFLSLKDEARSGALLRSTSGGVPGR